MNNIPSKNPSDIASDAALGVAQSPFLGELTPERIEAALGGFSAREWRDDLIGTLDQTDTEALLSFIRRVPPETKQRIGTRKVERIESYAIMRGAELWRESTRFQPGPSGNPTGENFCQICSSFLTGGRPKPRAGSCTRLLYDPRWTLSQHGRWPDHLCYDDFAQRSIEVWVSRAVGRITPALELWATRYPLPVGEAAARRLYAERGQSYPDTLAGLLPFRGVEEAYWGLRVEKGRAVADMFGLIEHTTDFGNDAGDRQLAGGFAYSLRGIDDTSLMELVKNGKDWWDVFSLTGELVGRPRGSGAAWASTDEFETDLRAAEDNLLARGDKVTNKNVAYALHCDPSTLKRWLKRAGIKLRRR